MAARDKKLHDELGLNDEFDLGNGAAVKTAKPEKKALDPEDDRENWPTINIEMEKDRPNYEVLIAYGTKQDGSPFGWDLQVMRGVDVKVPPSIVHALRDAVATHYVQRRDPVTGTTQMIPQNRKALPWTLVSPGKYIR
jgi:hypothetical protein